MAAANDDIWGSLSCTLLVHPATEAAHGPAVQRALDALRYGCVAVNAWSVVGFLSPQAHWGAFAREQTIADVGSGGHRLAARLVPRCGDARVRPAGQVAARAPPPCPALLTLPPAARRSGRGPQLHDV